WGGDRVAAGRRLAVVPQRVNLDRSLTARQNLVFHAAYQGVPGAERNRRADTLLEQFGLADRGGDKVDRMSGGQSQRLMIARALMHAPQVLFLDEPTTGLDPQARLFVWDRIRELRERGVTILLTTHDMDEAAELTDRVGIVDHGKLLALDSPEALIRRLSGQSVLELSVKPAGGGGQRRVAHRRAGRPARRGQGRTRGGGWSFIPRRQRLSGWLPGLRRGWPGSGRGRHQDGTGHRRPGPPAPLPHHGPRRDAQ